MGLAINLSPDQIVEGVAESASISNYISNPLGQHSVSSQQKQQQLGNSSGSQDAPTESIPHFVENDWGQEYVALNHEIKF